MIGTRASGGATRLGTDVERQIAISRGALRFQPLTRPGWGRQGIAYGPFRRENGLVFAVSITNGHNTSQGTPNPDSFIKRIYRWGKGPNADPWPARALAWALGPRKKGTLRRILWWMRSTSRTFGMPDLNENLALGWFTTKAPADPPKDGCGFIMHAAEGENGELWARVGNRCLSAFRRLMNLQVQYVVVLRERGAVYYAAASQGAHGMAAFPMMRPVAIDPFNDDEILYPGIHQSALGQIGFRVDTRVHGVRILQLPELASPFGTAHAGDPLTGNGPIEDGDHPNPEWHILKGSIIRTGSGAVNGASDALAIADPGAISGLVHAMIDTGDAPTAAGLAWRVVDRDNYWLCRVSSDDCKLVRVTAGVETVVASDARHRLGANAEHSLQILDSHGQIGCYLNGDHLFDAWIEDDHLEGATGVGLWLGGNPVAAGLRMREFEAHPRAVPIPEAIRFDPPWSRFGGQTVYEDDFAGAQENLAEHVPQGGSVSWERTLGIGSVELDGHSGAKVQATVEEPFPNRAFYTLPWSDPDFADLEVAVTPPGTCRGQQHRCRVGLAFWQDKDNYLSISTWLDDIYGGASMSVFTKRWGFEELYDAVWTNVADKIVWGKEFRLRVAFDGDHFNIYIDDEPIMQRALTDLYPDDPPLRITRVGIAINWEWGTDTGSTINRFTARR
ncbi:DNA-binding protein [Oricola nitratireducens]|uniref:DNA-binding protein n=1 Tax=Oricola nitratireducens TaxID=2775868 RepID=UPI0031BA6058